MKISTFKYFTIDACKSLKRNRSLSAASVATVAATLFILGIFMLLILNINMGMESIGSKLEVKIFLKENITMEETSNIERAFKNAQGFDEAIYETKEQALENIREQLGEDGEELLQGFTEYNPFPNSYIVRVKQPEYVQNIVDSVSELSGIEKVKYAGDIVDKIINITNTIKWFGIAIFAILLCVSLFLIANTIKLTVYSRKKEIGIMKYVGATDWFIRWPFIIEGILIGLIGSLISSLILYYLYKFIFIKTIGSMLMINLLSPEFIINNVMGQFILGGIAIGIFGSSFSIRKFLKV